ncbi:MAG: hypothetical protein AAGE52_23055 [Myxococcota bacterium]
MRRATRLLLAATMIVGIAIDTASAQAWGIQNPPTFAQTIQRVVQMPHDADLQRRVQSRGLNVVNVMWEDTGRFQGSSVGPNISDLTLQVRENLAGDRIRTHLLPVIRHPNFSDRTADVRANKLWVRVGNHREDGQTHAVPLREVLGNLRAYLSDPGSLLGDGDFNAERYTHYLVSAQHVFVPIQREGRAEFNPVLYNYQSSEGNPAVLVLLVTRQGTSATVIENRAGDQSLQGWGQQLYFNHAGQRTVFTAERRSAVERRIQAGNATSQDNGALEEGADMMMVIQVPLRHRRARFEGEDMMVMEEASAMPSAAPSRRSRAGGGVSDVEQAVIGHGEALGPFREMGGLRLVRDDRFPVRVTMQFYKATSNGVVSDADIADAHRQIERVYEDGDFVGSLVVPSSDRTRPTEWRRLRRRWLREWRTRAGVEPVASPTTVAVNAPFTPMMPAAPGTTAYFQAFARLFFGDVVDL